MAVSVLQLFTQDGDLLKIYDAVLDDVGGREGAPRGLIYHFCAPVEGGLCVCDLWETREDFERFAQDSLAPSAAKHGMASAQVEISELHEMVLGRSTDRKGVALFVEWEGRSDVLLRKIDEANARMNVFAHPPDGLVIHWTIPSRSGIRVIDHWRSRDDFERFLHSRLGETMDAIALPPPRITQFEVYNTLDRRVAAHV